MPGRRDGLQPTRGVDEVAGDHALVRGTERHGRFAGQHAGPRLDPRPEGADRVDEFKPGSDGSLGVVLVGGRRAPDRHHGIADELLDRPAVAGDDVMRQIEVPTQQLAGVLGVPSFRKGREPDEIGEQDADDASFGDRRRGGARCGAADGQVGGRRAGQLRAAFATELGACRDRSAARGAADREGLTALDAELAAGLIDRAAVWTGQRALHASDVGLERSASALRLSTRLPAPRGLEHADGVQRQHLTRLAPAPVDDVGRRGHATTGLPPGVRGGEAAVGQRLRLEEVEPVGGSRVGEQARVDREQDSQTGQDVVVPICRPVQSGHAGMDLPPPVQGTEEPMVEEELGRPTRGSERLAVSRCIVICGQPDGGRPAFVERRPIARRSPVAVPTAIGPLPLEELGDEALRAHVLRIPEAAGGVDRIALHRRVCSVEPIDPGDRLEVPRVRDPGQLAVDGGVERGADIGGVGGQGKVGQGDQPPVQPGPLAVWADRGIREVEQRRDDRTLSDLGTVSPDRRMPLRSTHQPGPRAVADGWLVGRDQPVRNAVQVGPTHGLAIIEWTPAVAMDGRRPMARPSPSPTMQPAVRRPRPWPTAARSARRTTGSATSRPRPAHCRA